MPRTQQVAAPLTTLTPADLDQLAPVERLKRWRYRQLRRGKEHGQADSRHQ